MERGPYDQTVPLTEGYEEENAFEQEHGAVEVVAENPFEQGAEEEQQQLLSEGEPLLMQEEGAMEPQPEGDLLFDDAQQQPQSVQDPNAVTAENPEGLVLIDDNGEVVENPEATVPTENAMGEAEQVVVEGGPGAKDETEELLKAASAPGAVAKDDASCEPSDGEPRKEESGGKVVPVWLFLMIAAVMAVLGATAASRKIASRLQSGELPPGLIFDIHAPNGGHGSLPQSGAVPSIPCAEDPDCGQIMQYLLQDNQFPERNVPLLDIPGTCQNWTREWLRTNKDVIQMSPGRLRQRFAMAMLYCEFNGDNWLSGELWVSELHECDWYSILTVDPCDHNEQYQIIRNYGQQMKGTLPPELSLISSLYELTLSDNLLSGNIPTEYSKLSQLDTLSLSFNLLEGSMPAHVWKYEDMTFLDLAYNFFTGTIPETAHLTVPSMKNLFLENNDMSGSIPTEFGSLDWHKLHLDGNEFTGAIPEDLNSPNLQELSLHSNSLTGTFPAEAFANDYAGKSKLTMLTLYDNPDVTGSLNEMCNLMETGLLEILEVDMDNVECECCTDSPVKM